MEQYRYFETVGGPERAFLLVAVVDEKEAGASRRRAAACLFRYKNSSPPAVQEYSVLGPPHEQPVEMIVEWAINWALGELGGKLGQSFVKQEPEWIFRSLTGCNLRPVFAHLASNIRSPALHNCLRRVAGPRDS
jgi:hypothetical protein